MAKPQKWLTVDNVYKAVTLLGLITVLYLNNHYITIDKFNLEQTKSETKFGEINKTLSQIAITLADIQNQRLSIQDHESRIRVLERGKLP